MRAALRVIKAECLTCHSEEKKKGGLCLTSRETLLKGGDDGVVVVPGQPGESRLLRALARDADPHMPPKKQLSTGDIASIRDWIRAGLSWDAAFMVEEDPIEAVVLEPLPSSYQPVFAAAISPNGAKLAFGRGGEILVQDLLATNHPVLARWPAHRDAVQALAWSLDGRWLISGAFRRLVFWDGASFQFHHELTHGLAGRVIAIKPSPADGLLGVADSLSGQAGFMRLLDPGAMAWRGSWRAHADAIFDFDFSRDGRRLVTAGGEKLIKMWDVATHKELARLEGHTAPVLAVAFNTNATQIVSGGADKQLKVWDIATREKIITLGSHVAGLNAVAWPGDGTRIYAVTDAGAVFSYSNLKAHTGEQSSASGDERRIGELADAALCLAVSSNANTLVAGAHDGVALAWNQDGKVLARWEPGPGATNAVLDPKSVLLTAIPSASPGSVALIPSPGSAPPRGSIEPATMPILTRVALPTLRSPVVALSVEPAQLHLTAETPQTGYRVTARTAEGFEVDVTEAARFSESRPAPFIRPGPGEIRAFEPGHGILTAHFAGQRVSIPVMVEPLAAQADAAGPAGRPVSFVRDLLPALSRAGCNAGPCHAKPEGQNGFKLSVFSYDPRADYVEIVKKARGRRVFPAAPDESLILRKPLTLVPHEGGLRFEPGSETHRLLARWLREGMLFAGTNEPSLQRLTVFPKARRYYKGATQRLLVRAHYSDGSTRDVTRLAAFAENDKEMARVDEHGVVRIGALTGQAVVVARYMGLVADAQILVPADQLLPADRYASLPRENFIDDLADARFQELGLFPSGPCTDAEFLRRAKLDAVGLLPTPDEVRAFLADMRPDKRVRFIDAVLEDPAYADYWANKWADLLRPNPDRVGVKSVFVLDQWIRESFRQNKPYDQFVREILLAEGTNHRDGPAVIYRDRREPADLTTMFSQLFLGTRLECARCHHHPNEKWSQDDFYQFAAYFSSVKQKGAGISPPISAGTETFFFSPGGTVRHPVTQAVMAPRPPDGPPASGGEAIDPRRALADWLTAPDNPFFARACVNRVWAVFFGRGLVEPVDDFRVSNPCVDPGLLDALARDFARHHYDLKHLFHVIMTSRLYQLSSTPNEWNMADTRNFSRAYRRRLPAEVLMDAVNDATGVPDALTGLAAGGRATQAWTYKIQSHFLDAFGRPNSSSDCPCERDTRLSVVQSLHLMNAKGLQGKLSDPAGRARRLADSSRTHAEIVREIYLVTLGRPPADEELSAATRVFEGRDASRRGATEDVFWALLNSPEFVFNH